MKLLVATRADSSIKAMTDLTHPIIKRFAEQWGADFLVLGSESNATDCNDRLGRIHYRIMKFYDLLAEYDRIIQLDSDIVVNSNCPNLFELVPHDKIGTILEDKGSRRGERLKRIAQVQGAWGILAWNTGYINTGVFVISRLHKEIFRKFSGGYWEGGGMDDVHLGYQIHRLRFKIFELHWRFNHMSMFSEPWNRSASRFNSYILHYAGCGSFPDKRGRSRAECIKADVIKIYGAVQ